MGEAIKEGMPEGMVRDDTRRKAARTEIRRRALDELEKLAPILQPAMAKI
ncbi:MAG: hypothetical protein AAF677_09375 [Pseudomonadota bacterium]